MTMRNPFKKRKSRRKGMSSKQMSSMYWRLRKKKMSHSKSFRVVGSAKKTSDRVGINGKWKNKVKSRFRFLDFDGDRKVNKYDCRPFNKKRTDGLKRWYTVWSDGKPVNSSTDVTETKTLAVNRKEQGERVSVTSAMAVKKPDHYRDELPIKD